MEVDKSFWVQVDVEETFDELYEYLTHLKHAINTCTATDREYVQGMNMITLLDSGLIVTPATTEILTVSVPDIDDPQTPLPPQQTEPVSPPSPLRYNGSIIPLSPPYPNREDLMTPLLPLQLPYQFHTCSQACVPHLPPSAHHFRGHNPLRIPLLCSFQRQCVTARGVVYKAPCGLSLCTPGEVLCFLVATESHGILQVDDFTFDPLVQLECLRPPQWRPPGLAERDLSRGSEPTPVELCLQEEGVRPEDFRYRKERWPHGCFLSSGPLFTTCCDCTDGCGDAESCACACLTPGGKHYSHQRLSEHVPKGLYECGPWCGCDRGMCQNRVVQRGLRVRLQVFPTGNKGWGVRCRDDLDRGTFVCTYAGVVLRAGLDSDEPLPPKRQKADLPSDDEVEVVDEWLAPAGEGRAPAETLEPSPPSSPPDGLHVPVIQRPGVELSPQIQAVLVGNSLPVQPLTGTGNWANGCFKGLHGSISLVYDGVTIYSHSLTHPHITSDNLSLQHSCDPNLFVQNVFTDSHDPNFPVIAFFTSKVVKAGTELTWNYSHSPDSDLEQKVTCQCGCEGCQGLLA
uniref:Histone-lysine N-methyltransferase SETDB2 n=1 Tax=Oncorhynchus tshawytscha TaxID=74940 RepID=A0AAZ3RHK5_ONCTS